ncbi:MAG TPA: 50S ribosomal protein L25/general stress protein Ctc [Bacillus sp. (in: firmicutes)]|uniref:50S ribosomal protein L25/general stress protein Ctc n=1 Tax=Bacillus litorisediminis TaxID=2922713 RepID=UPI001FAFC591|nr:50S ribosomal protein L25/general stress protein Ctc [Bacillus litorisediminis]HWO76050.1 50S ribosomal protein L25/general stress protein Ctc [Bacillus sp. (in: firmicutes)]
MATYTLEAEKREKSRHSVLTELRQKGMIPAVVYGRKTGSTPISISEKDFLKTVREAGKNGIISLNIDGDKTDVILTDYQHDFLKNEIIHADFFAVDMSSDIEVEVPLVLIGEAAGVKDGGVLQQATHELYIKAKPKEIPASIEIDVTNLQVGDTVTVADIKTKGITTYEIKHDDSLVIASILPPKQEEEINSGEEQAEGTPEKEEGRETEPDANEE